MRETIHGHSIDGDPAGLNYLEMLKTEELETLISKAKSKGKAEFEYSDRHYGIFYASSGIYVVAKVESDSGWL